MEYERVKAILSSLYYSDDNIEEKILPSKKNLWVVVLISLVSLLLYIVASILYIVALYSENNTGLLFYIIVVETIITAFSIIVSCVATNISNRINDLCIKYVNNIKWMNEPKFDNVVENISPKPAKYTNVIFIIVFSLYFISSLIYYFNTDIENIEFVSICFCSISTILTIILALSTTISYFSTGKVFLSLLASIKRNEIILVDEINQIKITNSNKR